jgi:hypothetical protein
MEAVSPKIRKLGDSFHAASWSIACSGVEGCFHKRGWVTTP